jgi:hypothetical protein
MRIRDSYVFYSASILFLLATVIALAKDRGVLGGLIAIAGIVCIVWAIQARQHEDSLSREAAKNAHPTRKELS